MSKYDEAITISLARSGGVIYEASAHRGLAPLIAIRRKLVDRSQPAVICGRPAVGDRSR